MLSFQNCDSSAHFPTLMVQVESNIYMLPQDVPPLLDLKRWPKKNLLVFLVVTVPA
jgi:hypothetical protein